MNKAKILIDGELQTVCLPKSIHFEGDEVLVNKMGDVVVLMPKDSWKEIMVNSLSMFTDDFMKDYKDFPIQEREGL